jgi:hypothetical protein
MMGNCPIYGNIVKQMAKNSVVGQELDIGGYIAEIVVISI